MMHRDGSWANVGVDSRLAGEGRLSCTEAAAELRREPLAPPTLPESPRVAWNSIPTSISKRNLASGVSTRREAGEGSRLVGADGPGCWADGLAPSPGATAKLASSSSICIPRLV